MPLTEGGEVAAEPGEALGLASAAVVVTGPAHQRGHHPGVVVGV